MTFNPRRLATLRVAAGFSSQGALAARLGVSRQSVNGWETGLFVPSGEIILPLVQALACQLGDLYGPDPLDHDTAKAASNFKPGVETG